MIISEDNISFNIDTLEECIREMQDEPVQDREGYLEELVADRLHKCNELHIEEFRKSMRKLMEYVESESISIHDIPRFMKKVSRNMRSLYVVENAIYKIL